MRLGRMEIHRLDAVGASQQLALIKGQLVVSRTLYTSRVGSRKLTWTSRSIGYHISSDLVPLHPLRALPGRIVLEQAGWERGWIGRPSDSHHSVLGTPSDNSAQAIKRVWRLRYNLMRLVRGSDGAACAIGGI
jgi:hypothetical protein